MVTKKTPSTDTHNETPTQFLLTHTYFLLVHTQSLLRNQYVIPGSHRNMHTTNGSFVTIFPYELLDQVFSKLSWSQCIQCTRVARSWRSFLLLQWNGLWSSLSDLECSLPNDLIPYTSYIHGNDVHSLQIHRRQTAKSDVLCFLINKGCHSIRQGNCMYIYIDIG